MASSAISHNMSYAFTFRPVNPFRALALGLGAALLLVHLFWRLDTTFAGLSTTGIAFSATLFAAELYIALALIVMALADILPAALNIEPQAVPEHDLPSIDVFVVISDPKHTPKAAYSLAVASRLDYPAELVRLYLVGHGPASEHASTLSALAERTRATFYSAAPDALAGTAMNAALARTSGTLVLILNAGEAPTADLPRRLAGGFVTNPRLAYCDIPTFAIDGDPMLTDLDVTQRLPNDPGHFFKSCLKTITGNSGTLGLSQRTLWRRSALSSNGSLARTSDRPDTVARIRAAQQNWQRGIANRALIASLAPDTVREYLGQRLSMRVGTVEAAFTRDPIFAKELNWRERLSWLPAFLSTFMPIAWTALFAIPALAVLFRVPLLGGADMITSTLITLAFTLTALTLAGILQAGIRSAHIALWSEMLETMLSAPLLTGNFTRRAKTNVLPDAERANGLLVVLFALLLASTTAGLATWWLKVDLRPGLTAAIATTVFGACLFACLLGAIAEPRQRRLAPRMAKRIQAHLLLGGEKLFGRLSDISVHGARFIADELIDMPVRAIAGQLTLSSPSGDTTLPVQLSRQSETSGRTAFGLSFTGRTVGEFATVVRLAHRSGDAYADLCDTRAKPAGPLRMFSALSWRGVGAFISRIISKRVPQPAATTPARLRKV